MIFYTHYVAVSFVPVDDVLLLGLQPPGLLAQLSLLRIQQLTLRLQLLLPVQFVFSSVPIPIFNHKKQETKMVSKS
jgi:hypothetical protein